MSKQTLHYYIICSTVFVIYALHLDSLYVNIMEARNFITAREMVVDGHWILTTLDGLPRYEKPPLPTWIIAVLGKLFGFNTLWVLRFPSVIMTLVLSCSIYKIGLLITKSKTQSLHSVLILVTSFLVIFAGRNATWDIYAIAFMALGIVYLLKWFQATKSDYKNASLSALFIGLSFMSKGPVAHYSLLLPFIISYLLVYKPKLINKQKWPLLVCVFITASLSMWWPLYIYFYDTTEALRISNVETSAWKNRNVRPFWYYYNFLIQTGAWLIIAFVALWYPYLKQKVTNIKAYRFALLWVVFSLILLSLIPEKKSRYLLPVMLPLAFVSSFYLNSICKEFKTKLTSIEKLPSVLTFGSIGIIGIVFPLLVYVFNKNISINYKLWYILASVVLISLGLLILYNLLNKNIKIVFYITITFIVSIMAFGFPMVKSFYNNTNYKPISSLKEEAIKENIKIYTYSGIAPELLWDYGEQLPRLVVNNSLIMPKDSSFGLLLNFNDNIHLLDTLKGYKINQIDAYDLNILDSTKKGYKERLKTKLYLLQKVQ